MFKEIIKSYLPNFIIKDIYQNENQTKEISFLDLNKIYSKNIITEKQIEDFYNKSKDSFKDKFKSFRYLELKPENLIGKKDPTEEYFKKIDEIENSILDGNTFDQIVNDKKNVIEINNINSRIECSWCNRFHSLSSKCRRIRTSCH